MTQAPPLIVILDPGDDAALTQAVLARNNPAAGFIAVHPTPTTNEVTAFAQDILLALGKPAHRLQAEGLWGQKASWLAALAWLRGEHITQIAVLRTHLFSVTRWARLAQLREDSGAAVFAYCHTAPLPAAAREGLGQSPYTVLQHPRQAAELMAPYLASLPERGAPASAPTGADGASLDWIPDSAVAHFRADARRALDDERFRQFDVQYGLGLEQACAWITRQPQYLEAIAAPQPMPPFVPRNLTSLEQGVTLELLEHEYGEHGLVALRRALLCCGRLVGNLDCYPARWADNSGLYGFLAGLAADCANPAALITRLRGAQAGFLLHGLLLVLPSRLRTGLGPGLSTIPLTAAAIDRLKTGTAHPLRAGALCAAMLTGATPSQVANTNLTHIAPDGSALAHAWAGHEAPWGSVTRQPHTYPVPAAARAILRAALDYHAATRRAREPVFRAVLGQDGERLGQVAGECGIDLPAPARSKAPSQRAPGASAWHLRAQCWRVGDPVHGPMHAQQDAGRIS